MLEFESIAFRNFGSFGDYLTEINLASLGQCLITGEIVGETSRDDEIINNTITKSNGSGKSTLVNAITWCLFGRTMHSSQPGDKVINWHTGKDCWAKLTFKNGDSIIRTRNFEGRNEVIIVKDGDESKFTSDTLSTGKNQQAQIVKIFTLDWDIFCGSVFFMQYSKSWLEMADTARKKAIERVLHVDRFTYYADVSKTKSTKLEEMIQKDRNRLQTAETNIIEDTEELERITISHDSFNDNKRSRIIHSQDQVKEVLKQRGQIILVDQDKLKSKWDVVTQINLKIESSRQELNKIISKITTHEAETKHLNSRIKLWEDKAGKLCSNCEQSIPESHTTTKLSPLHEEVKRHENETKALRDQHKTLSDTIHKTTEILNSKKPTTTLQEAKSLQSQWERLDRESKKFEQQATTILGETNPYLKIIESLKLKIENATNLKAKLEKDIENNNILYNHYNYVYKAYNDRNKIKSYIFNEHMPYFNDRLKYYLDIFGLDIRIELNNSLGITSNMWGYEFESGGERKRTDISFMFAMFDLHDRMYGRQSNVVVLDEVDGRMDDDGVASLVNIIKNDVANKVESVIIISHKNLMRDVFEKEIHVKRVNRFSTIESLN